MEEKGKEYKEIDEWLDQIREKAVKLCSKNTRNIEYLEELLRRVELVRNSVRHLEKQLKLEELLNKGEKVKKRRC